MRFGDFIKTTKGKLMTVGGVTVVAVGIVVAVLLQGGGYRSILVEQVEGNVDVVGERNNGQAYVGERLYSGDDVSVREASSMTMCMDNDKYVYADANTHFKLEASPKNKDSKIRILLDKGSELNELKSKLGVNDSYEVDTPNATMSVRGTIFRVTVYTGDDGLTYTLLEIKEGLVFVKLKTQDGTFNGVEREFKVGGSALVRGNYDFSEFVTGDDGEVERHLNYDVLPEDSVDRLKELIKGEIDLDIESDDSTKAKNSKEEINKEGKGNEADEEKGTLEEASDTEITQDKKTETRATSEEKKTEEKKTEEKKTEAKKTEGKKTEAKKTKESTGSKKVTEKEKNTQSTQKEENTQSTQAEEKKTEEKNTQSSQTEEKKTEEKKTEEKETEHVHTPGEWEVVKEATCTGDGSRQKKCTSCGEVVDKETIAATGHVWGGWTTTKAATCTSTGTKKHTCSKCGATETVKINALGHNWVNAEQATGLDGLPIKYCSRCGITK